MTDITATPRGPEIRPLRLSDIGPALSRGWSDFLAAPFLGVVFGGVYVAFGLLVIGITWFSGHTFYAFPITLGFPLVAPFAAVGLYETSRRIEAGLPLAWSEIFGVVLAERGRQLPLLGALMVVWFLFYLFFSHVLFALVMGPSAMTNILTSWEALHSPRGYTMMLAQVALGGIFALTVFATCVISLPMMMAREVDFVTAMIASLRAVVISPVAMLAWAVTVAALVLVALVPAFLGLFVVLPVLGHATWHIYRRVVPEA